MGHNVNFIFPRRGRLPTVRLNAFTMFRVVDLAYFRHIEQVLPPAASLLLLTWKSRATMHS